MATMTYEQWVRKGQSVSLKDGKVFYVHSGQGFPFLVMHLFGGSSWWFSRVVDRIGAQYSVYALDLPGFGRSDTPPRQYTIEEFGASVIQFMDKLGIERAHLQGTHGSSRVAINVATTYPARVAKLVLDGPVPWTAEEGRKAFSERIQPHLRDERGQLKPSTQRSDWSYLFEPLPEDERKEALKRLAAEFDEHAEWMQTSRNATIAYGDRVRLHLIQAPTLLVYGEKDMLRGTAEGPTAGEQRMQRMIKGSRLEIIRGATGFPEFEQPEEYARILLDFLGKEGRGH